jgi:hypothetical protein
MMRVSTPRLRASAARENVQLPLVMLTRSPSISPAMAITAPPSFDTPACSP